jgi:Cd2+/Zn2+-exporting ATPase
MVVGSDVALETADVALMSDELEKVPYALRLGRATLTNIRTNVAIALGLKLAFVGLAAFGVATLWMAILADTGASLLVTANSLRLLGHRA